MIQMFKVFKNIPSVLLFVLCLSTIQSGCSRQEEGGLVVAKVEQLFTGGLIYDGSGVSAYHADIGVGGGKILFIGDAAASNVVAREKIDVTGKWVTPGFIDMHSHAVLDLGYSKDAKAFLYQGITTAVMGVDGAGDSNIREQFASWEKNGIGVNGLLYVGHGSIRKKVMGIVDRAPSAQEMTDMKALVKKAMDEGAFGLSTGLFYVPGSYAETEEVIELAKAAARYTGAIYDTHDRDLGAVYQGIGYDASVQEGIRITEESGLRGIFSHYSPQGSHNYGRGDDAAKYINDARERGVDIWAAQHPYTATQSSLSAYTIPRWASAGGWQAMVDRFDDPEISAKIMKTTDDMLAIRGGAENLLLADPRPDLNGKTLAAVAQAQNITPALAAQNILRDGEAAVMNLNLYDYNNIRFLAQESWMMTCTDGRIPSPDQKITHPRVYGAFPKKMRMFVSEDPVISPEFAVRSFSGLAADFLRLPDRGYLRVGYKADLVVLDPDKYKDKATFEEPKQFSEGISSVMINGKFALRDGAVTTIHAGMALSRPQ